MTSRKRTPVTGRKMGADVELTRTDRTLRLLSDANRALIRATDERSLLEQLCTIVLETGGYRMAWVAFAEPGQEGGIRPAAHAGFGVDDTAWDLDAASQSLAARAIATGTPCITDDLPARAAPGARSAIALPLSDAGRVFGVCTIYATEAKAFDAREVAILSELASDLAYGVTALRLRAEAARTAAALHESHWQLEASQRMGHLGSWHRDLDSERITLSAEAMRIFGLPPDSAPRNLGEWHQQWLRLIHPEDRERVQAVYDAARAGLARYDVEYRVIRPDGRLRYIHSLADVMRDASGRPHRVLGTMQDITDEKLAGRKLYLLSHALDQVKEGIFLMEGDSPRFSYVNHAAAETLGYSREELTGGMSVLDIDPTFTAERWAGLLPNIHAHRLTTIETVHRTRDGRDIPVEITGNYFEFDGRAFNMAVVRDISERRAAEARLRAREREYRTLVENTPDLLIRWDRSLNRLFVNPAFAQALGRTPGGIVGSSFGTSHAPEAAQSLVRVAQAIREVFETGRALMHEHPLHTVDGVRTVQLHLVPERDEAGEVTTVLGIARDITALKETERQLRSLAEHSPDVILRFDREGRYLYANATLARLSGVSGSAHLGQPLGTVTGTGHEELYRSLRRTIAKVFASDTLFETEVTLPTVDGFRDFNVRLIPEPDEDGVPATVLVVGRDITAQKRAEADFRASEQRFRQVTETIDEVFWLTDATEQRFIYVSPAYERVFGRERESLYADPGSWLELVHPDDRARVADALTHRVAGEYDLEYRIVRGDTVAWIRNRAFPIRDASGSVYRIAGVAEDITVRRHLEEQLRQSQKMEAVGQLAGGIAHDFNNMLAVIQMQSSQLLEEETEAARLQEGLHVILGATERASNLTRQLLTFSRRQVSRPVPLDLSEALGNMTMLLRRVLGEDVALETRFAPALPAIEADPGMMEQVLMNLAINARDAMPGGGLLTVSLDACTIDAERAALHGDSAPGRYVCLTVTDTGCGIPATDLPRIFDPFFTTKEVGKGTGLGLATVFGIVEQHEGWVEVESSPGKGTSFRVFLPAVRNERMRQEHQGMPRTARGGQESILLVEDEPAVRAVTRTALERYGYRIFEADSAASALVLWEKQQGAIDLLLTDLVMPGGMSGRELGEALSARDPALRIAYISGYSPEIVNRMPHPEQGWRMLQKPYTPAGLATFVRQALDERPSHSL